MSEKFTTRKGRVRRNVVALLSAVALGVGGVAVPQTAGAFIQDDSLTERHGDELGKKPKTSISLTLADAEVQAGESTTATIKVGSTVPFPKTPNEKYGESDATALILSIEVDERLALNFGDGVESVVRWDDGQNRKLHHSGVDEENNELTLEFAASDFPLGANPGFTLELPVTVSEGVAPGTELNLRVGSEVNIRPGLDWTFGNYSMQKVDELEPGQDPCVRRATLDFSFDNIGQYGTWLGDLWLGTNSDFQLYGDASFRVTGPNGEDLTSEVFGLDGSPVPTLNPEGEPEFSEGKFQNHHWLKKYDWRLDKEAFAGEAWIPEGSNLEIQQFVSSQRCTFNEAKELFSANVVSRNSPLFETAIASESIVVAEPTPPEEPTPTVTTETVTETTTVPPTHTVTVTETPTTTVVEKSTEVETATTTPTKTTTSVSTTTTTTTETVVEDCDCEPTTVTETTTAEAPKRGTIGDRVWVDENGDGNEDPGEKEGVPGVPVVVKDKDGNEVIRTVTDEDGNWKVDVEPGEYTVEYKTRDGYTPTDPSQVSRKVVVESGKEYLDVDLGVKPGEKTPPTPPVTETVTETVPVPTPPVTETVTETVPVPTTKVEQPNGKTDNGAWERCVANAVASPLLYLVPIAVLGAVGGELARPYMGAINEQLAKVNADIQAAMRRDTPDRGHGGAGRDNDQFAEIRAQLDAANRQIQAIGNDPNIQRFGTIALGVLGLVAAGGVLYDWCSNEKGEAFTSIKGGSSEPMPITTAPVTTTPEK